MKIEYCGSRANAKHLGENGNEMRIAYISFDETKEKELAVTVQRVLEKEADCYADWASESDMYYEVADREEYNWFVQQYKAAKKEARRILKEQKANAEEQAAENESAAVETENANEDIIKDIMVCVNWITANKPEAAEEVNGIAAETLAVESRTKLTELRHHLLEDIMYNNADNYNGFYKVAENNGGVCVGIFYNPDTEESFRKITWDIDDVRLDQDEELQVLRYMSINKDVRWLWLHRAGVIQVGDQIKVVKGRKVPIGTIATVKEIKPFYDKYRRWQADYAYLDNGMRTNVNNCVLA